MLQCNTMSVSACKFWTYIYDENCLTGYHRIQTKGQVKCERKSALILCGGDFASILISTMCHVRHPALKLTNSFSTSYFFWDKWMNVKIKFFMTWKLSMMSLELYRSIGWSVELLRIFIRYVRYHQVVTETLGSFVLNF